MEVLLIGLLFCVCHVNGMFFLLGEKETRCIFDELPEEATATFRYNSSVPSGEPIGLVIRIHDPVGKVMLKREYGSGSAVTFTAHQTGEHVICVSTNSTKWAMYATGQVKISFTLDIEYTEGSKDERGGKGEEEDDDDEEDENRSPGEANKLISLEKRIRGVMDSVKFITHAQTLYRGAEAKFRERAELINTRVLIWACVQLGILGLTGWWQMRSLKSFFIAKKIV